MSKRAEELAKQLYPDPKLENYDDILVYRADRDNAIMGRVNVVRVYEQAEKDLALTWEDIKEIQRLLDVVWSEQDITAPIDEDTIYKEALKRFNEARK